MIARQMDKDDLSEISLDVSETLNQIDLPPVSLLESDYLVHEVLNKSGRTLQLNLQSSHRGVV